MSNTRLILHVKGTQAETAELPKALVRAAVSQGQLTESQLIWSPEHNSWKQVRELPDLLPGDRLILHVKGTESETTELPRQAVRTAISEGKISHSQLIWSPAENTWKPVREYPDLLPSQELAPAPSAATAAVPVVPESPDNPVARAVDVPESLPAGTTPHAPEALNAPDTGFIPHLRVPVPNVNTQPIRPASATRSIKVVEAQDVPAETLVAEGESAPEAAPLPADRRVREDDTFHPFKWICIGMGTLVLLVFGANYLLVDRPLISKFAGTSFGKVPVYAHLGAFMQPNVMVIHIPASLKITPDNFADLLVALAHSTPLNPITKDFYERIALTSGWTAQYSFSGNEWKELGDMGPDEAQRKEFIMDQLGDAGGQPLMPESTLSEDIQQARRDQVWKTFMNHFAAKQ
jgi:hypothetical protein